MHGIGRMQQTGQADILSCNQRICVVVQANALLRPLVQLSRLEFGRRMLTSTSLYAVTNLQGLQHLAARPEHVTAGNLKALSVLTNLDFFELNLLDCNALKILRKNALAALREACSHWSQCRRVKGWPETSLVLDPNYWSFRKDCSSF
jgi:hypothetical protein